MVFLLFYEVNWQKYVKNTDLIILILIFWLILTKL